MMEQRWVKQCLRGVGAGVATFATGMLVYDGPPLDLATFAQQAWTPGLQGVIVMLAAWGINTATQQRP